MLWRMNSGTCYWAQMRIHAKGSCAQAGMATSCAPPAWVPCYSRRNRRDLSGKDYLAIRSFNQRWKLDKLPERVEAACHAIHQYRVQKRQYEALRVLFKLMQRAT